MDKLTEKFALNFAWFTRRNRPALIAIVIVSGLMLFFGELSGEATLFFSFLMSLSLISISGGLLIHLKFVSEVKRLKDLVIEIDKVDYDEEIKKKHISSIEESISQYERYMS